VYALPTEAQWEYCCRAGTKTSYYFGDTVHYDQANFRTYNKDRVGNDGGKEVRDQYREETFAVGSFSANVWGIHDMHGNAWEWCHDWYGEISAQAVTDPTGASDGSKRVLRGGGWRGVSQQGRSANRYMDHPHLGYSDLGFRLVLRQSRAVER
jgi:formylglycine-generating enzyme required for sulfatase activity